MFTSKNKVLGLHKSLVQATLCWGASGQLAQTFSVVCPPQTSVTFSRR